MYTLDTFRGFTDQCPIPDSLAHLAALIGGDSSLQVTTHGYRCALQADDAELALHHRQFEELTIEEELIYTYLRVPARTRRASSSPPPASSSL
jgi:hypothetical protein